MKIKALHLTILCLLITTIACTPDEEDQGVWLIPIDEVFDGGPGKDGIPSVDNPRFADVSQIDYLEDDDLVIGIQVGDDIRAYPHPVLDWHEIVNDEVGGFPVAITYCPLTGTGVAWDRTLDGQVTTFGVSGLLYNTNLIPYDRRTDSNWSQMLLQSVNGDLIEQTIETYPLIETTWASWKTLFPDSKVLTTETGFSRNYAQYPYGDYISNNNLFFFPVGNFDNRRPAKARGLAILEAGETPKFFELASFPQNERGIISDSSFAEELILIGSQRENFVVAFYPQLPDGTLLEFSVLSSGEGLLSDQEGNIWNIFGQAIEGPRQGTQLRIPTGYMGYFFSFGAFYPNIEIY